MKQGKKSADYYQCLWKVLNCLNLEIRQESLPPPTTIQHLTLSNTFFSQELLIKVDVFQQAVLRQDLPCSFWLALKQPERNKENNITTFGMEV